MARGFVIATVQKDSPAQRAGLEAGDRLLKINGSNFYDLLDFYYLCADTKLDLNVIKKSGSRVRTLVQKNYDETMGLEFSTPTIGPLRHCHNNCVFCFIDQQPDSLRDSLYQKDDDYRLSFLHGNYISLTNAAKGDLKRIIRRSISPLYISIHATDPHVRRAMMGNKAAAKIMSQLTVLAQAGITMHGQIVVCPGYNNGAVLQKTINDLSRLIPAMKTVALVPVGLTRYRHHLKPLNPVTPEKARELVNTCSSLQERFVEQYGTPFVYLADEFYLLSRLPVPPHHHYGNYEQLENGVGLVRLFLNDLDEWKQHPPAANAIKLKKFSCVTGKAAAPYLQLFMQEVEKIPGLEGHLHVVENDFWGGNVNVAGLLSGSDLLKGLEGKQLGAALFIPADLLKEGTELFLDNISIADVSAALGVPLIPVQSLLDLRRYLQKPTNIKKHMKGRN